METPAVLVIEADSLLRESLHDCLTTGGYRVVAQTDDSRETLRLVGMLGPDVVLLANDLPDTSGVSLCREICAVDDTVRVLLMFVEGVDDVGLHLRALLAGSVGCVSKNMLPEQWLRTMRYVLNGGAVFKAEAIRRALSAGVRMRQIDPDLVADPQGFVSAAADRRILVVEVPSLFRTGLVGCLQRGGYRAIREASDAYLALDIIRDWRVDLVIAADDLPEANGFALTREILAVQPAAQVLVMSWHAEDEMVQLWAQQAGAVGCVPKNLSSERCRRIVRQVLAGRNLFEADDGSQTYRVPDELVLEVLTRREQEVMDLVADGQTNRQISDVLNISERTVDRHVASILDKMGAATRTEAAVRWIRGMRLLGDV